MAFMGRHKEVNYVCGHRYRNQSSQFSKGHGNNQLQITNILMLNEKLIVRTETKIKFAFWERCTSVNNQCFYDYVPFTQPKMGFMSII